VGSAARSVSRLTLQPRCSTSTSPPSPAPATSPSPGEILSLWQMSSHMLRLVVKMEPVLVPETHTNL